MVKGSDTTQRAEYLLIVFEKVVIMNYAKNHNVGF
jgi:hypothetical protein